MSHTAATANPEYAQQKCLFVFLMLHLVGTNVLLKNRAEPRDLSQTGGGTKTSKSFQYLGKLTGSLQVDGALTYLNDE